MNGIFDIEVFFARAKTNQLRLRVIDTYVHYIYVH